MFNWYSEDGGFKAKMPNNVTLVVTPNRYAKFSLKPARGTKWHAQATHWNEQTRTASCFGRDEYMNLQDSAKAAMRLAEAIYRDAQ